MTSPWNLLVSCAEKATTSLLAAPYIKEQVFRKLLEAAPGLTSITCVTRWNAQDISSGVSDVNVREIVVNTGGCFLLHPTLHAKYYRFDDISLIGSANLTAQGLGIATKSNLEILSPAPMEFDSATFERLLLNGGQEVSDNDFAVWQAIPLSDTLPKAARESLPSQWRPNTRDPNDVWLTYNDSNRSLASDTAEMQARADLDAIMVPHGLSYGDFKTWVASAMLASPFVSAVRTIPKESRPQSFLELSRSWGMSPGDARYAAETVDNWLAYYLPRN